MVVNRNDAQEVRRLLGMLKKRHGGRTIELRVPPVAAVQLQGSSAGPKHSRGTPPNVAEMTPETFLALACGELDWHDARATFVVQASGTHVDDLADMLPVVDDQSRGSERDNSKGVT